MTATLADSNSAPTPHQFAEVNRPLLLQRGNFGCDPQADILRRGNRPLSLHSIARISVL
jgi:hypothetical protein